MSAVEYEPVIGLEIHVQLATRTKMFCGCELAFGAPPNTRTCPVCLGLPGALPVVNAQAIHFGLMMAEAFGAAVPERSTFHRKNYFYPDSPKAYQISQFDAPLCQGGRLGDVALTRIHLEEDAAKLVHAGASGRVHGAESSVVDFNRCGTPLAEMVTEPELRSAAQAREWLTLLRVTLRRLGVSDVNMEEGSLRCDANVSVRPVGSTALGTKTELKNMNSFRFLERGVEAEIARQVARLRAGEAVTQETLHFDPRTEALTSLRSKEEAHDYRYFPEPDLVAVAPTPEMRAAARAALPELPTARAERFRQALGLADDDARLFAHRSELGDWLEAALAAGDAAPRSLANWTKGELTARIGADADPAETKLTPAAFAQLVALVDAKGVNASAARTVLDALLAEGGEPAAIVEREGLGAIEDSGELSAAVDRAIAEHPDVVERIRGGNAKAIGALMGPVMKATKGRADGGEVSRLIAERLGLSGGEAPRRGANVHGVFVGDSRWTFAAPRRGAAPSRSEGGRVSIHPPNAPAAPRCAPWPATTRLGPTPSTAGAPATAAHPPPPPPAADESRHTTRSTVESSPPDHPPDPAASPSTTAAATTTAPTHSADAWPRPLRTARRVAAVPCEEMTSTARAHSTPATRSRRVGARSGRRSMARLVRGVHHGAMPVTPAQPRRVVLVPRGPRATSLRGLAPRRFSLALVAPCGGGDRRADARAGADARPRPAR